MATTQEKMRRPPKNFPRSMAIRIFRWGRRSEYEAGGVCQSVLNRLGLCRGTLSEPKELPARSRISTEQEKTVLF
jgi:hypothetical protein